jgi:hypothetical protein
MATTWTNEQKNIAVNNPPVIFNQSGLLFNQLEVLFGGSVGTTIWTDEVKI